MVFNIEAIPRVRAVAEITPSAIPTKASFNPCITIMRVTLEELAPSAMRIPISWMRCCTACAMTP